MDVTDSERHFSRREEKQLLKLAAEVSRTEFPNPERAGCPSAEILKALACRQIKLEETAELIDHIGTCSPCFAQYWSYRRRRKRQITAQLVFWLCLGIAAISGILISRSPSGLHTRSDRGHQAAQDRPVQQVYQHVVLDLRPWSTSRSDQPAQTGPDHELRLPRAPVVLSIHLPVESEAGMYELQLVHLSEPPLLQVKAQSYLRDIEPLEVKIDTTTVEPGSYLLRVRHLESGWSEYPVQVE